MEFPLRFSPSSYQVSLATLTTEYIFTDAFRPTLTTSTYARTVSFDPTDGLSVAEEPGTHLGAIIGGALGGLVAVGILCGILFVALRRSRRNKLKNARRGKDEKAGVHFSELQTVNDLPEFIKPPRPRYPDEEVAKRHLSYCRTMSRAFQEGGAWLVLCRAFCRAKKRIPSVWSLQTRGIG